MNAVNLYAEGGRTSACPLQTVARRTAVAANVKGRARESATCAARSIEGIIEVVKG